MSVWWSTSPSSFRLVNLLLLVLCSLYIIYFVVSFPLLWPTSPHISTPTSLNHVVFGIASSAKSWPQRKDYIRLWWKPHHMQGCVFLDTMPSVKAASNDNTLLPPLCISEDISQFRYTHKWGYRSAIRVARVVLETVALNHSNVRWFVFGEDNTVFFPENIVKTLSKYDHNLWYYIGSGSESFEQNDELSTMAFGGAGFAISYPLARVLANNLDLCLVRYPHLDGSDSRIFSCLAELGVGLSHEPGFHQVDIRGDPFGLLAAHQLTPIVSLHNLDSVEPIFPNMTRLQALQHLFEAVKFDPARLLQQTVCYDRWFSWTISVSWGYAVQVLEAHKLLPDVLPVEKTFKPWRTKATMYSNLYTFSTRELPMDPCKRPTIFFLESMSLDGKRVKSSYKRVISEDCLQSKDSSKRLEYIRVFSHKMDLDIRQLQAPRRHCCDILPSSIPNVMEIGIRECREEELIFMHS